MNLLQVIGSRQIPVINIGVTRVGKVYPDSLQTLSEAYLIKSKNAYKGT